MTGYYSTRYIVRDSQFNTMRVFDSYDKASSYIAFYGNSGWNILILV